MSTQINGNDLTVPGTATLSTAVITALQTGAPTTYSGLAWTPKTTSAVAVNGVAYAFPLSVVRGTFVQSEITALDVNAKSLTALTGLASLTALTTLDCSSNSLTALDVSGATGLVTLDASANALTVAEVDGVLADLDTNGVTNGTVDLSGGTNGIPSAAGLVSKAALEGKGWSVTVNS